MCPSDAAPGQQRAVHSVIATFFILFFKQSKKKKKPSQPRKMAEVEMDTASSRMNNGNEHV